MSLEWERALESSPVVDRACVVGRADGSTVVFVTLDRAGAPAWARARGIGDADDLVALAAHPEIVAHVECTLAAASATSNEHDPTTARAHVLGAGWLPSRDAFPARIRRRCVKARYAPLVASLVSPVMTSWAA